MHSQIVQTFQTLMAHHRRMVYPALANMGIHGCQHPHHCVQPTVQLTHIRQVLPTTVWDGVTAFQTSNLMPVLSDVRSTAHEKSTGMRERKERLISVNVNQLQHTNGAEQHLIACSIVAHSTILWMEQSALMMSATALTSINGMQQKSYVLLRATS